jgi:hypothetical protein
LAVDETAVHSLLPFDFLRELLPGTVLSPGSGDCAPATVFPTKRPNSNEKMRIRNLRI